MSKGKIMSDQADPRLSDLATKSDLERFATKDDVQTAIKGAVKEIIGAVNANTEELRAELNSNFKRTGLPVQLKTKAWR